MLILFGSLKLFKGSLNLLFFCYKINLEEFLGALPRGHSFIKTKISELLT